MKPDRVVIGAEDPRGAKLMEALYRPFTRTGAPIMVMDCASAELCKYAANALLATRISFMNEIANVCELFGADVDRVRQAVGADQRIGTSFLFPGVGYGGSCFPKDVKALVRFSADKQLRLQGPQSGRIGQRSSEARAREEDGSALRFARRARRSRCGASRSSRRPTTCAKRPRFPSSGRSLEQGAKVRVYDPEAMRVARGIFGGKVTYATQELRGAQGRRRAGGRDRVAGVPRARLRAHAKADAHAGHLRRP